MGFGGSSPPKHEPETPVPQEDDPNSVEAQRTAVMEAKGRDGYSSHLLSGGGTGSAQMKPRTNSLLK